VGVGVGVVGDGDGLRHREVGGSVGSRCAVDARGCVAVAVKDHDNDNDNDYRHITSSSGQSEAEWILQVPFWALFQGTFGAPA
jgi:hypothetical protein